ncbi:MAG: hypothetical protein R2712_16760 [Vicinamibacterales bacterium]
MKLHPHDIRDTFIRLPLPDGEEQCGRLTGERMKEFVNQISAISRQSRDDGDLIWGRLAGTSATTCPRRSSKACSSSGGCRT